METYKSKDIARQNPPVTGVETAMLAFARTKKPSGSKQEKRRRQGTEGKLPNHVRHNENAALATHTWGNKFRKK